jgi:hypothetical protein
MEGTSRAATAAAAASAAAEPVGSRVYCGTLGMGAGIGVGDVLEGAWGAPAALPLPLGPGAGVGEGARAGERDRWPASLAMTAPSRPEGGRVVEPVLARGAAPRMPPGRGIAEEPGGGTTTGGAPAATLPPPLAALPTIVMRMGEAAVVV